jgi:mannosyl-oligosaccharide alpha-1,2-mannosidase
MPEVFSMNACPTWSECEYTSQSRSVPFNGADDVRYVLRPEAIESVFYMFRITGEAEYQDVAWDIFQAIDSNTRTTFANAAFRDVMKTLTEPGKVMDVRNTEVLLPYFQ